MATLEQSAQQFIEDLVAQNMGGLMGTFTPAGMGKAMALGAGPQPAGTVTKKEAVILEAAGDDHPVDLHIGTDSESAIIGTVWKEVDGAWKVDHIEVKKQP